MNTLVLIQAVWEEVKRIVIVLQPAIFSIIVLAGGSVVLLFIPQGSDAVLALADEPFFLKPFWFFIAVILWAVQVWYWANIVYIFRYHPLKRKLPGQNFPEWVRVAIPRVLGIGTFMVAAAACFTMNTYTTSKNLFYMGVAFIVLAIVFLLLTIYLKKFTHLIPADTILNTIKEKTSTKLRILGLADLPPLAFIFMMILTGMGAFPLLLFIINPHLFTFQGSAAVIILCITNWVPTGNWILYVSHRLRLPVFSILVIIALIFNLWNDNHHVRVMKKDPVRQGLEERLGRFLEKYPAVDSTEKPRPLYIVTAEGGGIRAAYWTAAILSQIQDKYPEFHDQIFAISSVSGGSLGASVYTALVKEHLPDNHFQFQDRASKVLKHDFLSPTIAAMLSGDLLQNFIPLPVEHFSRGLALEQSFEIAWKKTMNTGSFSQPLSSLWENETSYSVPSLFLNSTWAERACQVIEGNIDTREKNKSKPGFVEAIDIYELLGNGKEMRLSTAVHNSARFAYISPAGTLPDLNHIVDGGYFDNSGSLTALEIFFAVLTKLDQKPRKVIPVILMITNTPDIKKVKPFIALSSMRIPVETLLRVFLQRTDYLVKLMQKWGPKLNRSIEVFHFVPKNPPNNLNIPLGWSLSETVIKYLDNEAARQVKGFLRR